MSPIVNSLTLMNFEKYHTLCARNSLNSIATEYSMRLKPRQNEYIYSSVDVYKTWFVSVYIVYVRCMYSFVYHTRHVCIKNAIYELKNFNGKHQKR